MTGFIKRSAAILLAAAMLMGSTIPADAAAYKYSPNDVMYLKGIKQTDKKAKNSYYILDVNGDGVDELLTETPDGKYDTLSIWIYSKKANKAVKKATVKKATAVYSDTKNKRILVAKKGLPKNTYIAYKLKKGKLVKKQVSKTSKKEKLSFVDNEPWVDSDIVGTAKAVGKGSLKDDFHLASNYSHLKKKQIETEYDTDYFISDLQDEVTKNIDEMFSDRTKYPSEKSVGLKICRDYYDFATDWDRRDKDGVEPVRSYVECIKKATSIDELKTIIADPKKSPFTNLIKYNVDLSGIDNRDWTMTLDIDDFSVSAYTLSEKNVPQSDIDDQRVMFEEVNYAILGKLGYSKKEIKSILSGCYELEKALCSSAHIYSDEKIEELLTTFTSYDELCKEYSRYPLKAVLTGYGVTGGRIALAQPDYMTALNDYFTAEHFTQIQSYLIAHNVMDMAAYLDLESCAISIGDDVPKAAKEKKAYINSMNEAILDETKDDGIRTHVDMDSSIFSVAIQDAYMDFFVDDTTQKELEALVKECKDSFRDILANESWMSEAGRKVAVEKLDSMKYFVMKPASAIDPSYLKVDTTKSFLDAMVGFRASRARHICSFVGKNVDRSRWAYDLMPGNGTTKVNAEYLPDLNQFYIYAGIVGTSTFTSSMTKEEQLGRLGTIIGHEMTHGFDPKGSQYDKNGSFVVTKDHPNGWFPDEDYAVYQKRIQRVRAYYDALATLPGITLDGSNLYGEAVADMGGMSIALKIAGKQSGFNYKKFFKSYADMWKRQNSFDVARANIPSDPHPPVYLRVNVTLQQFDEFNDTYGIKKGDGMYLPVKNRLVVW